LFAVKLLSCWCELRVKRRVSVLNFVLLAISAKVIF